MGNDRVELARTTELADGELKLVHHGELDLLVVRSGDGYFVTDAWCPHEEVRMDTGYVKDGCLHCPLHGSYFDLRTGKVMADPAEDDLTVYPVTIDGDRVLAELP